VIIVVSGSLFGDFRKTKLAGNGIGTIVVLIDGIFDFGVAP